jgi:hypothetical protein
MVKQRPVGVERVARIDAGASASRMAASSGAGSAKQLRASASSISM